MDIQLVFAYCPTKRVTGETSNAFGYKNSLPWGYIKQDMKNFSERTKGTMVVMGAKTFSSLPDLLSERVHMVVVSEERELPKTKNGKSAEYYIFDSAFEEFLKTGNCGGMAAWDGYEYKKSLDFHSSYGKVSVIGGAYLLQKALPYANKVIVSKVYKKHYVMHDVSLPEKNFIGKIRWDFRAKDKHVWELDELTSLKESVMVRICYH